MRKWRRRRKRNESSVEENKQSEDKETIDCRDNTKIKTKQERRLGGEGRGGDAHLIQRQESNDPG